jgi:hypothetical protein
LTTVTRHQTPLIGCPSNPSMIPSTTAVSPKSGSLSASILRATLLQFPARAYLKTKMAAVNGSPYLSIPTTLSVKSSLVTGMVSISTPSSPGSTYSTTPKIHVSSPRELPRPTVSAFTPTPRFATTSLLTICPSKVYPSLTLSRSTVLSTWPSPPSTLRSVHPSRPPRSSMKFKWTSSAP